MSLKINHANRYNWNRQFFSLEINKDENLAVETKTLNIFQRALRFLFGVYSSTILSDNKIEQLRKSSPEDAIALVRTVSGFGKHLTEVVEVEADAETTEPQPLAEEIKTVPASKEPTNIQTSIILDRDWSAKAFILDEDMDWNIEHMTPFFPNDLKLKDGSPIPLTPGDYVARVNFAGARLPKELGNEIFLPGQILDKLIRESKTVEFLFKGRNIELKFLWANTQFENAEDQISLLNWIEYRLYIKQQGFSDKPVPLEVPGGLFKGIRYPHPAEVKKEKRFIEGVEELHNLINSFKEVSTEMVMFELDGERFSQSERVNFDHIEDPKPIFEELHSNVITLPATGTTEKASIYYTENQMLIHIRKKPLIEILQEQGVNTADMADVTPPQLEHQKIHLETATLIRWKNLDMTMEEVKDSIKEAFFDRGFLRIPLKKGR